MTISAGTVESQFLKGLGTTVKAIGSIGSNIPLVKVCKADDWLMDAGESLEKSGKEAGQKAVLAFGENSEHGSSLFIDNLEQVDMLYNKTADIYFDKENVYLVADIE